MLSNNISSQRSSFEMNYHLKSSEIYHHDLDSQENAESTEKDPQVKDYISLRLSKSKINILESYKQSILYYENQAICTSDNQNDKQNIAPKYDPIVNAKKIPLILLPFSEIKEVDQQYKVSEINRDFQKKQLNISCQPNVHTKLSAYKIDHNFLSNDMNNKLSEDQISALQAILLQNEYTTAQEIKENREAIIIHTVLQNYSKICEVQKYKVIIQQIFKLSFPDLQLNDKQHSIKNDKKVKFITPETISEIEALQVKLQKDIQNALTFLTQGIECKKYCFNWFIIETVILYFSQDFKFLALKKIQNGETKVFSMKDFVCLNVGTKSKRMVQYVKRKYEFKEQQCVSLVFKERTLDLMITSGQNREMLISSIRKLKSVIL